MQVKDQFFGSWALNLSFRTCYEVNIKQVCSFSIHKCNIVTPERFFTMDEKCKFLSMGYITALTQASVFYESRMFLCDLKLLQKTPIIYLMQSGMVWEAKLIHSATNLLFTSFIHNRKYFCMFSAVISSCNISSQWLTGLYNLQDLQHYKNDYFTIYFI